MTVRLLSTHSGFSYFVFCFLPFFVNRFVDISIGVEDEEDDTVVTQLEFTGMNRNELGSLQSYMMKFLMDGEEKNGEEDDEEDDEDFGEDDVVSSSEGSDEEWDDEETESEEDEEWDDEETESEEDDGDNNEGETESENEDDENEEDGSPMRKRQKV